MPKALSLDLRLRVIAAMRKGLSYRMAAETFGVSKNTIRNWLALEGERGGLLRRPAGGDTRSWRIEAERDAIFGLLKKNPDLTTAGLRRALEARGLVFSYSAVRNFLKRHGVERARGRPRAGRPAQAVRRS